MTTSYLPLRITRKAEEFQHAVYAAVVLPSHAAHPHSNGNEMKWYNNHALGRWNNQYFATVPTKLFSHTSYAIHANE